jgi:ubiquinone/menaquinone biosynthesis C-methylase UbiE
LPAEFEHEWRERFEEFASLSDDDAGIAGWTTTGLDARLRRFSALLRGPAQGSEWLDAGCGAGTYTRLLASRGARVVGLDYSWPTLTKARARDDGTARYVAADVRRLPFADASFDGVVFLNSLHHAPVEVMESCLIEAGRVTAPEGRIVVIEPLADGSFFEAFRGIEDETEVRAAAQRAIATMLARGQLGLLQEVEYVRREAFDTLDQFLSRAAAADRSREAIIRERREAIAAALHEAAMRDEHGRFVLDQPLRAQVLAPGAAITGQRPEL